MDYYAHSKNGKGEPQRLVEHLRNVAEIACSFAQASGAGDLAFVLGLWHDLGKVNPEFQAYLAALERGERAQSTPHAI